MRIFKKRRGNTVVAVSGGFDPIHIGHVRMFREARAMGDELVVILNNDNWLVAKKGFAFMSQRERKEILEALTDVDSVVLTNHSKSTNDMSICKTLEQVKPDIFVNGGDRTKKNIPEIPVCEKIGCEMVFGIGKGGKVQSSSWLFKKIEKITHNNELIK